MLNEEFELQSDLCQATWGLFRERCLWLGFQGPEYGHRRDSSCEASETGRPSKERTESYYREIPKDSKGSLYAVADSNPL